MGKQFVCLAIVLFMILASLALTLVGILTDNWYSVEAVDINNITVKDHWTYHYGIWKKCYDSIPADTSILARVGADGNCIFIYKDLIHRDEYNLSNDEQLYLHLSRSHVAFAIVCGVLQLFTILTLICGVWPADCSSIKKIKLYLGAALLLLLATTCGSVSGICFIALRDLDESNGIYPMGVVSSYGWSFMIHWISTAMCLVESFILLCMLKESYEDVADKFNYYNIY